MAPATYIALLARTHLGSVTPLPKAEYVALLQSVQELSAIGRNLNRIARALNQGGSAAPTSKIPPGRLLSSRNRVLSPSGAICSVVFQTGPGSQH
jgi:hypothetical protein